MEEKKMHTCIGTCSKLIETVVEDGIIKSVRFYGGCMGNTQGSYRSQGNTR